MELITFGYTPAQQWSIGGFPGIDSPDTLVIVFGTSNTTIIESPFQELINAYPKAHIIGCSTSGEILGTEIGDDGMAVAVVKFHKTELRSHSTTVRSPEESCEAGINIAKALNDPSLRGVFILSEGLHVNGSELVRGLNSILDKRVVTTGGLAGDSDKFSKTWVIHEGQLKSNYVSAIGFYGDAVRIGHGSKGGWDMFGPERSVTRSNNNVLYELDDRPALDLYKEYLGERATGLPATGLLFPLALRSDSNDSKSIVRTILAVDENEKTITFAGDVPQGSLAQLMRANFDRLIEGASGAATMLSTEINDGSPLLSIAISCVGRRLVLGERTEEEVEAVQDILPTNAEQIGFYSYGEISPYSSGHCDLHNQTMTLTTISES